MIPHLSSAELSPDPSFNVVIAYEDLEAGKQAKKTYDFLAGNLGREWRFSSQMWKFEVLGMPKLLEMATSDAAAADIIIISCGLAGGLPREAKCWLERCLEAGTNAIALVYLYEVSGESDAQAEAAQQYLVDVASRAQMEFFAQPYHAVTPAPFARSAEPEMAMLPSWAEADPELSYPRWGINE